MAGHSLGTGYLCLFAIPQQLQKHLKEYPMCLKSVPDEPRIDYVMVEAVVKNSLIH